ncbi:MAG: hypothetical protein P8X93_00390 [Gammaproteobacteria bacterium]
MSTKVAVVAFLLLITTGAKAALDSELSTWLDAHPNVKANMVWAECLLTEASATGCATDWEAATCSCFYNSPAVSYDDWPIEMKELLHSAYQMRVNNQFIPVQDPPPFAGVSATGRSLLSQQSSRSIYIAHLAQTLWWELHVGRWSITALNSEALEILLSGLVMFGRGNTGGYPQAGGLWQEPVFGLPNQYPVTPGDPAYSYRYLKDRNLIGNTRRETIASVLNWARTQAIHSGGPSVIVAEVQLAQWQYPGNAPVSRILEGTRVVQALPKYGIAEDDRQLSRVPGCHGFTGLLNWLLRTVNIPVGVLQEDLKKVGHSLTYFVSEDLFLSHGDDYKLPFPVPEAAVKVSTDLFSGALVYGSLDEYDMNCLFIDRKTHDEWFVVPPRTEAARNVSRGATQCRSYLNLPAAPGRLRIDIQ